MENTSETNSELPAQSTEIETLVRPKNISPKVERFTENGNYPFWHAKRLDSVIVTYQPLGGDVLLRRIIPPKNMSSLLAVCHNHARNICGVLWGSGVVITSDRHPGLGQRKVDVFIKSWYLGIFCFLHFMTEYMCEKNS